MQKKHFITFPEGASAPLFPMPAGAHDHNMMTMRRWFDLN